MKKAGAITLLKNIQNEYKTETEVIFSFLKNTFLSIINHKSKLMEVHHDPDLHHKKKKSRRIFSGIHHDISGTELKII